MARHIKNSFWNYYIVIEDVWRRWTFAAKKYGRQCVGVLAVPQWWIAGLNNLENKLARNQVPPNEPSPVTQKQCLFAKTSLCRCFIMYAPSVVSNVRDRWFVSIIVRASRSLVWWVVRMSETDLLYCFFVVYC